MPVSTAPLQQGNAEQQLEADRRTDKLGQIGRHGDDLRLHPIGPHRRPRKAIANMLGQVFPGGDAQLGGQQLDQHRHHVGPNHHPQQAVAERGAGLDVGGEVAGIDIADSGDEGGPHQREFDFSGGAPGGGFNHATVQHMLNPY